MDDADRLARLRLIRSDSIGPVAYLHLIRRFGSAARALEAVPDLAGRGGGRVPRIATEAQGKRELEEVARLGARHLFVGDADYPPLLTELEAPPPVLVARGHADLSARPCIAMVGARNASAAGCRLARQFAQRLGQAGVVVVSGLARGIDTAAHDGALASGTIAVIAGGIDVVYPPENADRQKAIAESGLVIAEQPPGTEPRARHFPYRNRIIAGMAMGTVVIEAAPKSGSLITARDAAEYGREVMAVPGSPLDPRAQGCNLLIREGATLVQSVEDILEAVSSFSAPVVREPISSYDAARADSGPSDAERRSILELLSPTPAPVDEILRLSKLAPGDVQMVLLELELAGRVERHAGGRVSLIA